MKKRHDHPRLILRYFVSSLLIFMIPLAAMAMLAQVWFGSDISETYRARAAENIDMYTTVLEEDFSALNRIGFALSQTTWVRDIASLPTGDALLESFDSSTYSDALNQLKNYITVNGFVTNIALYFPELGYVIYKNGLDDAEWFFSRSFQFGGMQAGDWNALVAGIERHGARLVGPCTTQLYTQLADYYVYLHTLTFDVRLPNAYALFIIPKDTITGILAQLCITPGSYALLLDHSNTLLSAYSADAADLAEVPQALAEQLGATQFLKGETASADLPDNMRLLSFGRAQGGLFRLVSIYSEREVLSELTAFQNITLVVMLVAALVSLVLSYIIARRNEAPVRRIANLLATAAGPPPGDAFDTIEQNIVQLLKQRESLRENEQEYVLLRLRSIFEALLNRRGGDKMEDNLAYLCAHGFDHPCYCVALVQPGTPPPARLDLLEIGGSTVFVMNWEQRFILIFNTDDPQPDAALIGQLFTYYQWAQTVTGVGNGCAAVELNTSFNEARISLEYQLMKGDTGTVFYTGLNFSAQADFTRSFSIYSSRVAAMRAPQDWPQCANDLLRLCIEESDLAAMVQRLLFYKRVQMELEKLTPERLAALGEAYFGGLPGLSVEEREQRMGRLFQELYRSAINQRDSYDNEIGSEIKAFLEANFTNSSLSLSEMGDHFNVSASKMSLLFKATMGDTFVAYLSRLRTDQAKKLLAHRAFSIEEVGRMSGFENVHSFRRVFKKYEGITPSDYRN